MNETKVFADGYCGVFRRQEDFLACLKSMGIHFSWERKQTKNLRLVAITEDSQVVKYLKEQHARDGLDEEFITDTIVNT